MNLQQITEAVKRVMNESGVSNQDMTVPKTESIENMNKDFVTEAYNITLKSAKVLNAVVMAEAERIGVKGVCAVVNSGARPVAIECQNDSFIASYDIALNKAYTSVGLKMKTSQLGGLAQPNSELYGIQFTNDSKIVIFGGGVPLVLNGRIVGGFGVSGGTAEQDTYLGDFAEAAFKKITGAN